LRTSALVEREKLQEALEGSKRGKDIQNRAQSSEESNGHRRQRQVTFENVRFNSSKLPNAWLPKKPRRRATVSQISVFMTSSAPSHFQGPTSHDLVLTLALRAQTRGHLPALDDDLRER
jgi:hypothetical protein